VTYEALGFKLLHVGVAVPELDPAAELLTALFGYRVVSGPFDDPIQKVKVNFLAQGAADVAEIELIAPLTEDSPIRSTLGKSGGGAYHLCFETGDIEAALEHLVGLGCIVVAKPAPAVAFEGRRIAWIYTQSRQLFELVEAAAALHTNRPNLHVYLVGEGPDLTVIESAIQTCDATRYVHMQPPCTFDDAAVWITASDLITLPSYMEGCPNVVLEALACGRPVVATNVGGIPEIMGEECGRLVPPRDPARLAEALASVLDTTWDPATISAHWSRSWAAVATELREIFEAVWSKRQVTIHAR